jgi:hypothetical protein
MKRSFILLSLFLMTLSSTTILQAQQTWLWTAYNVAIDLPDDFEITLNNDNEFEAIGDGMELYMYIFEADISLEEMKDATLETAMNMELEEVDVVQSIQTYDFEGQYVAAYMDGDAVLLCGLINPENFTNFFALVTFGDNDRVAEDEAFNILASIRKNR